MNELLDWLNSMPKVPISKDLLVSKINIGINKENKQIIDAFVAGNFEGYKGAKGHSFILVNDYINKTYTENEHK